MTHIGSDRILVITHSYTPLLNPRAFRWSAICEQWVKEGRQLDVICGRTAGLGEHETINGVNVYRAGGSIVETLRGALRPKSRATVAPHRQSGMEENGSRANHLTAMLKAPVRLLHDSIWKNLYWPDYACLWIAPALRKSAELTAQYHHDAIITVSDPFSSHLVGREIKERVPAVKWLVDIGDPFCFRHDSPTNNQHLYRNLNYRTESCVFGLADIVTVTTDATGDKYADLFPFAAGKINVIPPLLSDPGTTSNAARILSRNDRTKLVYVGTLYRTVRNPLFLLNLFRALDKTESANRTELHLFGGYDDCADLFKPFHDLIGDRLFLHGLVNRKTVWQAMREADVLVNIGNANPFQLPSKVVEYASLGKPILNLHRIYNDSSKLFLNDYPVLLNLRESQEISLSRQAAQLQSFINGMPYKVDEDVLQQWHDRFTVTATAAMYAACLKPARQPEAAVV